MEKTYTVHQNDTLKSIVAKHLSRTLPGNASKSQIEKATLALLESNPQLDAMKPKESMKLTLPKGDMNISLRTMERYRVHQAMEKGEKDIPVSKKYVNELLEKMEETPTGKAVIQSMLDSTGLRIMRGNAFRNDDEVQ